ncbi:MAG: ABC transporter ATP-binding protein [Treponema sp.]|jgi:peptide/nickel transport system ATP-binding protein|nr:ABC transporter ATP-binding protein [Treponema sp.]
MARPLLEVEELRIFFKREDGISVGVSNVSFAVHEGVNLALIGESGSGKSVTALSCLHLLDSNARIERGNIRFEGQDITHARENEMRKIRGKRVSMIFQEPMTSLNPVLSIGFQLAEALKLHTTFSGSQIRNRCLELLIQVGIADLDKMLRSYPHELSGGMRQRVMIAVALACNPRLLIADEPTTALDVTIQAQILMLLRKLQRETGITILIITHDFGVVAEMADEVVVMYAGLAVERGTVEELFSHPLHPYTEGLLKSIIPLDASMDIPLYSIPGIVPSISRDQKSCPFYARCPYGAEKCEKELPSLREQSSGHFVRCFAVGGL